MKQMLVIGLIIFALGSSAWGEEIYCNQSGLTDCGNPFLQMVSDGDNYKFMFLSPDMTQSFAAPFTNGQSFAAIHFEIPKSQCIVGSNLPILSCQPSSEKRSVSFQGESSNMESTLKIRLESSDWNEVQVDDHTNPSGTLYRLTLSDGKKTATATAVFKMNECTRKSH